MNKLSNPYVVACEIYRITKINHTPATYRGVMDNLGEQMDEEKCRSALDTLFDWGIVCSKHEGDIRFLEIAPEREMLIGDLYDFAHKEPRGDLI